MLLTSAATQSARNSPTRSGAQVEVSALDAGGPGIAMPGLSSSCGIQAFSPTGRLAGSAALPAQRVDLVIGAAGVHDAAGHRDPRLHRAAGGEVPDHRAIARVQRVDLAVVAAGVHAPARYCKPRL